MRILQSAIFENEVARNFIERVSQIHGHQGTVIRFSEDFLYLYEIGKKYPDYIQEYLNVYTEQNAIYRDVFSISFFLGFKRLLESALPRISDSDILEFRRFREKFYFFKPYEIVIRIFNDTNSREFDSLIAEFSASELTGDYNVLVERRSRTSFLSNSKKLYQKIKGGISICGEKMEPGTLGGIIKSNSGKAYALTCAHVAMNRNEKVFQPARVDSDDARVIGHVECSSIINWCTSNSSCNPRIQANNMDACLIELLNDVTYEQSINNLGRVVGTRTLDEIDQNMEVELNGRTSGTRKRLIIGGLCVSYKIAYQDEDEDKFACFTNLIELREPNPFVFSGYNIQKCPVKAGDSGSWVCSSDEQGYRWCGMLISGDNDRGYFIPAEDINSWLVTQGYDLNPYEIAS